MSRCDRQRLVPQSSGLVEEVDHWAAVTVRLVVMPVRSLVQTGECLRTRTNYHQPPPIRRLSRSLADWISPYSNTSHYSLSASDGWFYSRSESTSITTFAIGSVITHCLQWVLPCSGVTLYNIIFLLIYPAAFVSSMLYRVLNYK